MTLPGIDIASLAALVVAATFAGFIDAVVGGGGLIQIPALFSVLPHEPAATVFGTNKLSSVFGTGNAAWRYARRVDMPWRTTLPAAVAAFAYGRDSIVVDINVRRFLVRVLTGNDPALSYTAAERSLAEHAHAELEVPPALWAAAAMEFGALVCTARAPLCDQCPLASMCDWVPTGQRTSRPQAYEGTDRQARGAVLAVLREGPADDFEWHDAAQLQRALDTLLADGLIVRGAQWSLPG